MHRAVLVGVIMAATLCVVERLPADDLTRGLGAPIPIFARIEGYIGPKPADHDNLAHWLVSCLDKEYPFQVTKIDVLQGDVSYMDIVENAVPYHLAYYLRGPHEFLRTFATTPPGERIVLLAYLRASARQANIAQIYTGPDPTPAVTPSPSAAGP